MSPWNFIKYVVFFTEEDIELTIEEILGFIVWLLISTVFVGIYLLSHYHLNFSEKVLYIIDFSIGFIVGLIFSPIGKYIGQIVVVLLEILISGVIMLLKNES